MRTLEIPMLLNTLCNSRMDEDEILSTQQQRIAWIEKKRRQRQSLTPEQRESENARRRARRHANNIAPREIQFQSPSIERQRLEYNHDNTTTSSCIRRPLGDITNLEAQVSRPLGTRDCEYLYLPKWKIL